MDEQNTSLIPFHISHFSVSCFKYFILQYFLNIMAHSVIWGPSCEMKKKVNKNSEPFKIFWKVMLQNTASLVHLVSTMCKIKGLIFLAFCKFDWMTSSAEKEFLPI